MSEQDWLDECRSSATRDVYAGNMATFKDWYKKPLSDFMKLEPREMRHTALKFQSGALDGWKTRYCTALKPNSIIAVLTALGSFCTFNDKPLLLRGKRVRPTIDLTSHAFADADLRKMFNVAGTQEKALLSTFCSLGWEVSSVISLERAYIQNMIVRAQEQRRQFIYFIDQRKKTGAIRLGVLNPLAIEWIGEWLKVPIERIVRNKGQVKWDTKRLFSYTTKQGVNSMMKHLARDAQITLAGRVHTHQIRKWVMSGLSRAGWNEFQIKFLMGKTIPLTDMTYLQTLQQEVESRYPKAYAECLDISGKKQSPFHIRDEDQDLFNDFMHALKEGRVHIET